MVAAAASMGAMTTLLLLFCVFAFVAASSSAGKERTYIVSMEKTAMPTAFASNAFWYSSVLASVKGIKPAAIVDTHMLHVYDTVFEGFSAKLSPDHAAQLESMPECLGIFPDRARQLHTTRTPQFLGLDSKWGLWPKSAFGSDVIVGVLDTGIWPESKSFSDAKIGPVPKRWKGICEAESGFNASMCNRKLVGARYFLRGYEAMSGPLNETLEARSPRDTDGHGTHTASTAAGRYAARASLLGYAAGMAKGVAPKARVAAYKVCWASGCFDSDILAAFDRAVADGVDVISLSVGGGVVPYYMDSISIGAFGAMERGVFVAASGGNQGPAPLTVTNISPWITTIGASTLDRDFPADVLLGNGQIVRGVSLYSGRGLRSGTIALVDAAQAAAAGNGSDAYSAGLCMDGSLDRATVTGKIVICSRGSNPRVAKGQAVRNAGGAGMILANSALDGEGLVADAHVLPATAVGYRGGATIRRYISATRRPVAQLIFRGTVVGIKPAPVLASFSSRGPNPQTPEILKPDLIAPGVNILAAWSGAIGPSGLASDHRIVDYNIISGTSMACPHVSGVAALLRSNHPTWSPAALRSALMTTAYTNDNRGGIIADEATSNVSTPFDYGAGHVNPQKAMDPGLVYDLSSQDYVDFLCAQNYSERAIQVVARRRMPCRRGAAAKPADLNYPSFAANFDQSVGTAKLAANFRRTVTNVGPAKSSYTAKITSPAGVLISVRPSVLNFQSVNQKLSYTLSVSARPMSLLPGDTHSLFGSLSWTDGIRVVQSPIALTLQQPY